MFLIVLRSVAVYFATAGICLWAAHRLRQSAHAGRRAGNRMRTVSAHGTGDVHRRDLCAPRHRVHGPPVSAAPGVDGRPPRAGGDSCRTSCTRRFRGEKRCVRPWARRVSALEPPRARRGASARRPTAGGVPPRHVDRLSPSAGAGMDLRDVRCGSSWHCSAGTFSFGTLGAGPFRAWWEPWGGLFRTISSSSSVIRFLRRRPPFRCSCSGCAGSRAIPVVGRWHSSSRLCSSIVTSGHPELDPPHGRRSGPLLPVRAVPRGPRQPRARRRPVPRRRGPRRSASRPSSFCRSRRRCPIRPSTPSAAGWYAHQPRSHPWTRSGERGARDLADAVKADVLPPKGRRLSARTDTADHSFFPRADGPARAA